MARTGNHPWLRCFYARATTLLSRAAGGALSPIRVKQPGALLEYSSSWRIALTSTTTTASRSMPTVDRIQPGDWSLGPFVCFLNCRMQPQDYCFLTYRCPKRSVIITHFHIKLKIYLILALLKFQPSKLVFFERATGIMEYNQLPTAVVFPHSKNVPNNLLEQLFIDQYIDWQPKAYLRYHAVKLIVQCWILAFTVKVNTDHFRSRTIPWLRKSVSVSSNYSVFL